MATHPPRTVTVVNLGRNPTAVVYPQPAQGQPQRPPPTPMRPPAKTGYTPNLASIIPKQIRDPMSTALDSLSRTVSDTADALRHQTKTTIASANSSRSSQPSHRRPSCSSTGLVRVYTVPPRTQQRQEHQYPIQAQPVFVHHPPPPRQQILQPQQPYQARPTPQFVQVHQSQPMPGPSVEHRVVAHQEEEPLPPYSRN